MSLKIFAVLRGIAGCEVNIGPSKVSDRIKDMKFEDEWNTDMALQVLQSETVDSQTWADAVKWLLLFGPPAIKEMLLQASTNATEKSFPNLRPAGFNEEGDPYYDLVHLAETLGADPETLYRSLMDLETESESSLCNPEEDVLKIQ